jgi:hypothetical protein
MAKYMTKNGRFYEFNGEKYPSVTTILSKGIPKPGLIKWAAKFVATEAYDHFEQYVDKPREEAIDLLAASPDRRRNSSANLGSVIHAAADAFANGRELPKVSKEAKPYVEGFRQFVVDFSPEFRLTEQPVFNRTHGYAGTLDIVAKIDNAIWIIDTKTGNRVYPEVALQLAAYRNAEFIGADDGTEKKMPRVSKGGVIHLSPTGYSLIPVRVDEEVFDAFLSVKDIFHWDFELSKVVLREPIARE